MKNKILSFVLLLGIFSIGTHSLVDARLERTSSGPIPHSYFERFDRLEQYAPNLKQWGPWSENYYVQLGDTRPLMWGPWYTRTQMGKFFQKKTKHIDLQRARGKILYQSNW